MNDLDLFSEQPREERRRRPARVRQRRKRRSGSAAFLFSMAFLVAVVGTGGVLGAAWLNNRIHPPDYSGAGTGTVTVQVAEGATGRAIGDALQEHGVIRSVAAFLKVYAGETRASSIQPGFYQMRQKMSSHAAMALLLDPKSRAGNQITIPEGQRASEIYGLLAKKTGIPVRKFQTAAKDGAALGLPSYARGKVEGYLFPGRYDLDPNASAAGILKDMVARFKKETEDLDLESKASEVGLKPGDVVVLASLLQAEGGTEEDYPKIARVLYNRLNRGMKLQLDTTVLYALNKRTLHVTYKDTAVRSPYSTYYVKGLPAGAIDSPGEAALKAALAPAKGDWLYFVTTDPSTGYTEYGVTDADFTRMKNKLDKWLEKHPE
ncbi:putative aminodeoxychorismate lyase [Actinomadura rubteroloni]|uniref:Endolytic murein transglycosylase n=1 Tax=Actinomadura rubteroloni TaxID=1926885 RepID=A0A2P4UDY7_9ACTN|nr:endolytic transglycosylase MltG [Actinomadura rubteroloni]POM23242.1 putative aminodeoxychorismate lyase [Actinomadura rubteroloni]